jgi:hypothetical protein
MTAQTRDAFQALTAAKARLAAWGAKIDDGKTFQPIARCEYGFAFDRLEKARADACRADAQRYAEIHPLSWAQWIEFMPDRDARRAAILATDTDAELQALIASWRH